MAELLGQAWLVLRKDLLLEFRSKTAFLSMLSFTVLVLAVFHYAHDPTAVSATTLAPSILWITFSFAGMLGLNRGFAIEKENRAIDGLRLAPLDPTALYIGKLLANLLFVGTIEILALPFFAIFYGVPIFSIVGTLLLVVALATVGFVSVGTLLSVMAVSTKFAEMILGLLALPFLVTPVAAAAQITTDQFGGLPLAHSMGWLRILIAFDVVFLVLCALLFETTLEE